MGWRDENNIGKTKSGFTGSSFYDNPSCKLLMKSHNSNHNIHFQEVPLLEPGIHIQQEAHNATHYKKHSNNTSSMTITSSYPGI